MSFSNYLEGKLLDEVFGGTAFSAPGTLWVGISTTTPGEAGTGITEPAGAEYARVLVLNNGTKWNAASNGTKSNNGAVTFPTATSNWGTIAHFFVIDAGSGTANVLVYGTLDTPKTVGTNDVASFADAVLKVTLD